MPGAFVSSVESDASPEVSIRFERFSVALRAHMDIEERFHIPALLGSDEDLTRKLKRVIDEHDVLRRDLASLAAEIASGRVLTATSRQLSEFATRLIEHERFEESLFPHSRS